MQLSESELKLGERLNYLRSYKIVIAIGIAFDYLSVGMIQIGLGLIAVIKRIDVFKIAAAQKVDYFLLVLCF